MHSWYGLKLTQQTFGSFGLQIGRGSRTKPIFSRHLDPLLRGIVVISDFMKMQNDNYALKNTLTAEDPLHLEF
jgi:hypothetical protein